MVAACGLMRTLVAAALLLLVAVPSALAQSDELKRAWPHTDFAQSTVDLSEIVSGGPSKDGIPSLSNPKFVTAAKEDGLADREPVLSYRPEGSAARAYPVRYLMWHEIVNDEIDGRQVVITFCPLCNTGMVFDPRLDGEILTFGVSGLLRHSDMVMYDHQTESWWQQATGEAIVGGHTGVKLVQLPARLESWGQFRKEHPDGLVMAEPDWNRAYGSNPYVSYDSGLPFLYTGEDPPHGIAALERVVRVGDRAWPLKRLRGAGVLREVGLVLTWTEGQASALDSQTISDGREVGNVRVRDLDGRDVVHDIPFAFAFHAFHPDGKWMLGN